jgi:regulator of RNase E activity RraA
VSLQSSIQEATVQPGDFIIADQDGVVCLPAELAEKVLDVIPAIASADEKCAKAIKEGMSVQEAFATYRGKK